MSVDDTGERRRLIDGISLDDSLELVCTLAYEKALQGGDEDVVSRVELAVLKLRSE